MRLHCDFLHGGARGKLCRNRHNHVPGNLWVDDVAHQIGDGEKPRPVSGAAGVVAGVGRGRSDHFWAKRGWVRCARI